MGIVTLLMTMSFKVFPMLKNRLDLNGHALLIWATSHTARLTAMTQDTDATIFLSGAPVQLVVSASGSAISRITVPPAITLTLNRPELGFTADGTTKYAGTVTLTQGALSHRITLQIGPGKTTLHED